MQLTVDQVIVGHVTRWVVRARNKFHVDATPGPHLRDLLCAQRLGKIPGKDPTHAIFVVDGHEGVGDFLAKTAATAGRHGVKRHEKIIVAPVVGAFAAAILAADQDAVVGILGDELGRIGAYPMDKARIAVTFARSCNSPSRRCESNVLWRKTEWMVSMPPSIA